MEIRIDRVTPPVVEDLMGVGGMEDEAMSLP